VIDPETMIASGAILDRVARRLYGADRYPGETDDRLRARLIKCHEVISQYTSEAVPAYVVHAWDYRGWLKCSKCCSSNEYADPPAQGPFVCGSCRVQL
jgi:hypothetical protein